MLETNTQKLLRIIQTLRSEQGCPWDRAQTHESLIPYLQEESAEVIDAILKGTPDHLKDELGDLLLQVTLHAEIASESHDFDFEDIAGHLAEKMIRRHPHVFSDVSYSNLDEQAKDWDRIKKLEKKESVSGSILDGIPASLSTLSTALKLQKKASKVGFDWNSTTAVFEKIDEEIKELHQELSTNNLDRIESELGDIFFALVNLARHLKVDPDTALARTNIKFRSRFAYIEQKLDKPLEQASLVEMDILWDEAKQYD